MMDGFGEMLFRKLGEIGKWMCQYVFIAFLFTHFFGKNAIEKPKENWEVEREWKFFG